MAKKRLEWHDSDAPDAKGKFKNLPAPKLAAWLIRTRNSKLNRIIGSLNQQIVFKIAPSTTISENDIDILFDALDHTLGLGWLKIISSFITKKVKSLIPIPN